MKRTLVVMLVRAVGVAPLWKDSAALCIAGSRVLARNDFGVDGDSVAGYRVGCLLRTRGVYFYGAVDGESLVVVDRIEGQIQRM